MDDNNFYDWLVGATEKSYGHVDDRENLVSVVSSCCKEEVALVGDNAICRACKEYCDTIAK